MKIYAGNLSYEVTEEDLRQEFGAFGEVTSVSVITDKYSGRPKGFGFVEMASKAEGEAAVANLNEKPLKHMTINVVVALPLSDKKGNGSYIAMRGGWSSSRVRQRRYKIS
jgi:RNA recognition motif-containing protein